MARVLGVGWSKTGTTTLGECLKTLGYDHESKRLDLVPDLGRGDLSRIMAIAAEKESFEDFPWLTLYREFDEAFPECRFILTERDLDAWLKSWHAMAAREQPEVHDAHIPIRTTLYGLPFPDVTDDQLVERVERHMRDVKAYFAERPGKLLVVNWARGDGWEELCGFLGKPVPDLPFPHANKGVYRAPKPAPTPRGGRLRNAVKRLLGRR
jgi:hypothetical protein